MLGEALLLKSRRINIDASRTAPAVVIGVFVVLAKGKGQQVNSGAVTVWCAVGRCHAAL